jgi:toxin ParE1/3/4
MVPRFSDSALRDLEEIDDYSVRQWGERRAEQYLAELSACCERLAANPLLGRQNEDILPGLRRITRKTCGLLYGSRRRDLRVANLA